MHRTPYARPLLAAIAIAAALATGAGSENRPFAATSTPAGITPPQRAEAESPKTDVTPPPERPRQLAESPAPRRDVGREARPEPKPEQYAEKLARAGYEYWIQVGSNTDEAASRAQWEKMQSAAQTLFANVGNRIQRADLGRRGVYYRIQVGPFASPGTAGQFCAQLKARLIDCFMAQPELATASTKPPEAAPPPAPAPKKTALPAPKPIAKPEAKPEAVKPLAKPAEPKPAPKAIAKQAPEPKPSATPAEKPKEAAATPKMPDADTPPPLPDSPPKHENAEKPDAPISTAPGLPGVLD